MTFIISKIRFRARAVSCASVLAVSLVGVCGAAPIGTAWAQTDAQTDAQTEGQTEGRQFSSKTGEAVNAALDLAKAGQTASAINALQSALSAGDLNAYERSTIYQMIGQYAYQLDRLVEAQAGFEGALAAGGLLPKEVENTEIVIAQLMIGNGQYRAGAERLETYLKKGGQEKPEYIKFLVDAWAQAQDFQRALPWAEKWFNAASPKTREHFDLLNFLYNNLGLQGRQADIVKEMIGRWPEDKELWDVWASMLSNGGRDEEAFEVKKIMYLKGLLTTEPELLKIVQYYSFYDMPYQAAEILESEMASQRISKTPATLEQLSDLFRQARDYKRAIPFLESAARQSKEGITQAGLYAKLGEALYNEGDCQKSEIAFKDAMSRGYDAGKSWMLIASCRYDETIQFDRLNCEMSDADMAKAPITHARNSALDAFANVSARSGEYQNAQTWVQFVDNEKQAVKQRCGAIADIEKEACFLKIKLAYDAIIFTPTFDLEDKSCEKYIPEYDAIYRPEIAAK